jgi:hypothetical protein
MGRVGLVDSEKGKEKVKPGSKVQTKVLSCKQVGMKAAPEVPMAMC